MANIKIRQKEIAKAPVKKVDRRTIYKDRLKNNMVKIKEKTKENTSENEEESPSRYGINKITEKSNVALQKGLEKFNKYGRKATIETKRNMQDGIRKIKQKVENRTIKTTNKEIKKTVQNINKTGKLAEKTINNTKNTIKTVNRVGKGAYKTVKRTEKGVVKGAKKTYQIAKTTTKGVVKGIKVGIKGVITSLKAIIAGTKALIAFLMAGGWILGLIIIIICLIGLICSSAYGIFFSNEKEVGDKTMSSVVREVNNDFTKKITEIQNSTEHNDYEISSNRATWKDILSIYAVLVTGGNEQSDVITLNNEKIAILKRVFWDMNIITCRTGDVEKDIETFDDEGNSKIEKVTRKVLYIDITSKSLQEMIEIYNFNSNQIEQLADLQKDEYNEMWAYLFYGTSTGSTDIVEIALSQVGNKGRTALLVLVWFFFKGRVVCLFCQLVCK